MPCLTKEAIAFANLGYCWRQYQAQFADDSFPELERVLRVEFADGKRNCRQGFPCKKAGGSGTCISKRKTCNDAAPGEPKTHQEYVDKQLRALKDAGRLDEADAVLYSVRRITRTQSELARAKLINSLRDRLEKDEQLNAVLEAIDIEAGIKNPKQLALNVAGFRVPEVRSGLSIASLADLKPLSYSDQELNAVTPSTERQHEALKLARDYIATTKQMDSLLAQTKTLVADDEYEKAFSKTSELAERLKGLSDIGKALVGKIDHPELDKYAIAASGMSKEVLPGYQILLPQDLGKLRERAASRGC